LNPNEDAAVAQRSEGDAAATSAGRKYSAPAAACAADVLLALAREASVMTIAELVASTGATKSLIHRTLVELEQRQLVARTATGGWTLGLATVELGGAFAASVPMISSVRGVLRALADELGETVSLGTLAGDQALYLAREEGARSVLVVSRVGKRLPANAVAIGKALLAAESDNRVRARFAARLGRAEGLDSLTTQTITSIDALLEDLRWTRERGYAEELEEAVAGRCCIGVRLPLDLPELDDVAISVSMDRSRHAADDGTVHESLLAASGAIAREADARLALGERLVRADVLGLPS
jgi:DNA-binding IclR family transcriptional regulator